MKCNDKLYEFLKTVHTRLANLAPEEVCVTRKGDRLVLHLPFQPVAVYAPSTALYDAGGVDFGMAIEVTAMAQETPKVKLTIYPHRTSWIWDRFKDDGDTMELRVLGARGGVEDEV